jgi:hypothetical protein
MRHNTKTRGAGVQTEQLFPPPPHPPNFSGHDDGSKYRSDEFERDLILDLDIVAWFTVNNWK